MAIAEWQEYSEIQVAGKLAKSKPVIGRAQQAVKIMNPTIRCITVYISAISMNPGQARIGGYAVDDQGSIIRLGQ